MQYDKSINTLDDICQMKSATLLEAVNSPYLNRNLYGMKGYVSNGFNVPRVTSIIEYCKGNQEFLLKWAAKLGSSYEETKKNILLTGTKAHDAIDEYLKNGTAVSLEDVPENIRHQVANCVKNFDSWYTHMVKDLGMNISLIGYEVPLVCPWFGGITDAIMDINGKRFIVDFKSSSRISIEYFIQTSAYKWMVDNFYHDIAPIDGIGIVRVDKEASKYEDIFIDCADPECAKFVYHCQGIFAIALNMVYNMNTLEGEKSSLLKKIKQSKNEAFWKRS